MMAGSSKGHRCRRRSGLAAPAMLWATWMQSHAQPLPRPLDRAICLSQPQQPPSPGMGVNAPLTAKSHQSAWAVPRQLGAPGATAADTSTGVPPGGRQPIRVLACHQEWGESPRRSCCTRYGLLLAAGLSELEDDGVFNPQANAAWLAYARGVLQCMKACTCLARSCTTMCMRAGLCVCLNA
jgi:hypothetical protein